MKHPLRYSRRLVAAAAIVAGLGLSGLSASTVFAARAQRPEAMESLVEAIAKKFNLKVADVQAVVEEQRQQMELKHEEIEKTFLDKAVTDGKLTQAQADAIVAKKAELRANAAGFVDMDEATRQTAFKSQMDSLTQWAATQGIPLQYLRMGPRPGMRGHHPDGKMHGRWMKQGFNKPTSGIPQS